MAESSFQSESDDFTCTTPSCTTAISGRTTSLKSVHDRRAHETTRHRTHTDPFDAILIHHVRSTLEKAHSIGTHRCTNAL